MIITYVLARASSASVKNKIKRSFDKKYFYGSKKESKEGSSKEEGKEVFC
jgi:hypothetical protein